MPDTPPSTPAQALAALREGNRRFVSGVRLHPNQDADHRAAIAPDQRPFAVVFGCSDSRLAAEIIFDRGLGDLFVVRTAGHVIGTEVLGSIEYGVAVLGAPLVVVLGHDSCGAVDAGLQATDEGIMPDGFVRDVVERVMLSVLAARASGIFDPDAVGVEHVKSTVELLVKRSKVLSEAVENGACAVVGMSYRLVEGCVCLVPTSPGAPIDCEP